MNIPTISREDITRDVTPVHAVDALEAALRADIDPAKDAPRTFAPVTNGELCFMPSEGNGKAGVKLLSIAPNNAAKGRERIQGLYLLMDAETLTPEVLIDGIGITNLRTSSVSALAARHLAPEHAEKLVVFGTGPQGKAHIEAMCAVRPDISDVVVIGRDGARAEALAAWAIERGLRARIGHAVPTKQAVSEADIVVCATTAAEPLFDAEWLREGALAVAVGSHEADKRELPGALLGRAHTVVEDRATALREAGDVILAIGEGHLGEGDLIGLRDLVRGEVALDEGRARVFKSTGQSWEDLAVAAAIAVRVRTPRR